MTHVTCRLTAKNRDQLRNPTLGNRVWAAFLYLFSVKCTTVKWHFHDQLRNPTSIGYLYLSSFDSVFNT